MKYTLACWTLLVAAILQVSKVTSFQTSHSNQYQCQRDRPVAASASTSTFTLPKFIASTRITSEPLRMAENESESGKDDFWQQQRALMNEMSDQNDQSLKDEQSKSFAKVQSGLIVETAFFSSLLFSVLWLACDNPFTPFSYVFGSVFGVAYAYGLGKYVEVVGGTIDDAKAVEGAGVGQARFAFLILLFVFVGKFRAYGLQEIPSIAGFFTYQLATLSQGLKEEKIV